MGLKELSPSKICSKFLHRQEASSATNACISTRHRISRGLRNQAQGTCYYFCPSQAYSSKGQNAHRDLFHHWLGRENLSVEMLYHFLQCLVLGPQPRSSEAAHMFTLFPSVSDNEPVPSQHPEICKASFFAGKYGPYESLRQVLSLGKVWEDARIYQLLSCLTVSAVTCSLASKRLEITTDF